MLTKYAVKIYTLTFSIGKRNYFFYHRIFFLLIFIMSTEMGLLPTFFSDLFHTLWFGKRILCDYKMKFKNTREIFICCDACYDGCDIYITTGGFNKKKQKKRNLFSKLSLSNVAFFLKVLITLFPFRSIYLTYLFLTCDNNVSLHYWQILKLDFQTWVNLNTNFIFISDCICSSRAHKTYK